MDRLRYQAKIVRGEPNCAPAVVFLRRALAVPTLTIGTICHSLWLFCADTTLLRGRSVTCAHNVICDVENAGGIIVYEGDETADIVVDGTLVSAKHPGIVDAFMERFVKEMRSAS